MKARWITAVLILAAAPAGADWREDLNFAARLGARGLDDMALEVLDELEKSGDPAAARAGRYGKALLQKQQASIARLRFLRALEEGKPPPVTREEVVAIYEAAKPKIEDYVTNRADDVEARFLLAEMLQEYAEFLVGADYPDELEERRDQLVSENASGAEKLFEAAVGHYEEVAKRERAELDKMKDYPLDDPHYIRHSNAMLSKAKARMRWALLYPKGPKFNFHSETAIEELDEFAAVHFDELFGAFAQLDLGILYLERGLRNGTLDDAETALNYFSFIYENVKEDPTVPETSDILAKAFYWYVKGANAIARGEEALKKAQPVFFENAIRAGGEMRQRLSKGLNLPFALKATLLVADAYAAQERFNDAVTLAGEALSTARVEGHRSVARLATEKLTEWVARVTGAGVLDPALLLQIGDSLAAQGRTGSAITFYEKALGATRTEEGKERFGYPAMLRIAREYRGDRRYFAGAEVAWQVVQQYLDSGQEEESAFGQIASDACNVARVCWKQIAEATSRRKDEDEYQRVLRIFRDRFPGHPENSDAAFNEARELFTKERYEEAAKALADISPSSRSYWLAQRMVPSCYRQLATGAEDEATATRWHEKTLEAARKLVQLAESKSEEPGAAKARQTGHLLTAMALASLERWKEALASIDDYLQRYPDDLVKRGLEYLIKIDAHLAQGQLDEAEMALAALEKRVAPTSSILRRGTYTVFSALREAYQKADSKQQRVALAGRAATLLEKWMTGEEKQDYKLQYFYGEVLRDAERWADAASAYETAADMAPDDKQRQALTLLAAEMQYRSLKTAKLPRKEYIDALEKTRQLFTDVLIPPGDVGGKEEQTKVLRTLGDPNGWPSRAAFEKVRRNPRALAIAAEIYAESSPPGIDGRYVTLRLIHHLHGFTRPTEDPSRPELDEYIPLWWDAAELKLKTYLAIAQSGSGALEQEAAKDGLAFARKILFEYPSMDGQERVASVKALESQLRLLAPR